MHAALRSPKHRAQFQFSAVCYLLQRPSPSCIPKLDCSRVSLQLLCACFGSRQSGPFCGLPKPHRLLHKSNSRLSLLGCTGGWCVQDCWMIDDQTLVLAQPISAAQLDMPLSAASYSSHACMRACSHMGFLQWTGFLDVPDVSGTYVVYLTSSGGSRLYLDDALVINNPNSGSSTVESSHPQIVSGARRFSLRWALWLDGVSIGRLAGQSAHPVAGPCIMRHSCSNAYWHNQHIAMAGCRNCLPASPACMPAHQIRPPLAAARDEMAADWSSSTAETSMET